MIFTTACRSAGALVILIVVTRWPPEHPNHPDNLKDPDNPGLFEKGATVKVENLHWGQSGPALQKTPKQSFSQSPHPRCKYLSNIFINYNHRATYHSTRPKYLRHILPPTCWNFYWLLTCCCFFSFCLQIYIMYHIKSERSIKIFHSETIVSLKNGGKFL